MCTYVKRWKQNPKKAIVLCIGRVAIHPDTFVQSVDVGRFCCSVQLV